MKRMLCAVVIGAMLAATAFVIILLLLDLTARVKDDADDAISK